MADVLLRTKLMPPPGHANLIERGRIQLQLLDSLTLPLTLIVATAGAGKTSLVRYWRTSEHGNDTLLAWVALDEDDNDPVRFWRYVIAALETMAPDAVGLARATLDVAQEASIQAALVALINGVADLDRTIVLALDDYHLIQAPEIHEQLAFFIENLPAGLRLLMLTRADPPLPLARWRARGQMGELRNADLRFSEQEAAELMGMELNNRLTAEQIARLNARTEGWAAGLHLAALALRNREDADSFLQSFAGSHHFVLTYLAEDVLERLSEDTQQFLMDTSILSQLTAPLCDAVTERNDSAGMLQRLARVNLFTMPLDEEGTWYRYHQLFSDVLLHQLQQRQPGRISELHRRASEWYETQGLISQAIDHALRGTDVPRATRLIESTARTTLSSGEARLVQRWIEDIPQLELNGRTRLLMAGAWAQLIIGPLHAVENWISRATSAMANDASIDHLDFLGEVAALRTVLYSFQGRIPDTIAQANVAREHLVESDLTLRGIVAMSLGHAHRFDGNMIDAASAYREAVELGLSVGNLYIALDSMADLGIVLMRQGKLREANTTMSRGEQELIARGATNLPVAGAIATTWPDILLEMNEPETALGLAQRGLELGRKGAKADLIVNGHRSIGMAYWALRQWDLAFEHFQECVRISLDYGLRHTIRGSDAKTAHMHLSHGDLAAAQAWASRYRPDADLPGGVREAEEIMLARVCIASGDPDSALQMLAPLVEAAELEERLMAVIECRILEALALQLRGDPVEALEKMSRALRLAAPEGYVRRFLDEGQGVETLLHAATAHGIEPAFTGRLLAQLGVDNDATDTIGAGKSNHLIEPLSDREEAVLRLLSAGLNAPEIADELYVAASTVRSHLKSIYRKLDVHSRDQAISRARELNLV